MSDKPSWEKLKNLIKDSIKQEKPCKDTKKKKKKDSIMGVRG